MRNIQLTAIACAALSYQSALVQAQEPDSAPSTDSASPSMTPPRLLHAVEPVYPESERAHGRAASVGLILTLDADGQVIEVSVSESAGADFDTAAVLAARDLVFEPARQGDTKVAAKIPFRFDFELAAASSKPPARTEDATSSSASTPTKRRTHAMRSAEVPSLDVDVEGERPPREPTRQVLAREEIQKLPGTNGDALRSVQSLPGVARPPELTGLLIVRGSSPRDSQVFIDGTNVPIAYHFGGLSSVIPSEMLERIDFYPGNFGPEYGRASGGIVDVETRSPRKEGYGGLFQVDMLDARLLAEGAVGDKTRFLLAGRRSWLDAWLKPVVEDSGLQVSSAPVYYDYQAMIEHDVTRDTTARLFAYGSDDSLELLLSSPNAADPSDGGDVKLRTQFWRTEGRVETRLSDGIRWRTSLAAGRDHERFAVGALNIDVGIYRLDARSEVRTELMPELSLTGGIDVQTGSYDVSWRLPAMDFDDNEFTGPLFGRPVNEIRGEGRILRPAAYLQVEATPLPGLKLFPSIRADYSHDTESWTADPRLGMRYDVRSDSPRTTLKGGIGVFHQPPELYESVEPFGTPGVKSERALHYSLGVEQELARPLELSVEGFYKDLDKLVVSTPAATESETGVSYENYGSGRSYGSEFLLRYKPEGRFFGWVAYTLSKSERRDAPGEPYHLFEYDQTHVLTALGSMKLGWGIELGARFRYVSGSPYTPTVGGVMDYDAGAYAPVVAEPPQSARLPAFHQLDVRVDKTWQFTNWNLTAYLDVQNAYNHQNSEGVAYNYDFSQQKSQTGLPILPIFGIRGEL